MARGSEFWFCGLGAAILVYAAKPVAARNRTAQLPLASDAAKNGVNLTADPPLVAK